MIAISDINLNHNCLIAVKNIPVRSQLKNCNTIEVAKESTKYGGFWSSNEENYYKVGDVKNSENWVSSISPTK